MFRPRRPSIELVDEDRSRLSREQLSDYLRLLKYVRPYRRRMGVAIVALTAATLLGLLMPLVITGVIDVVFVEQDLALLNQFSI